MKTNCNYLIITGGSRGIGEKTIACFMQQGWQAINISRSPCNMSGVINVKIDLSAAKNVEKNTQALQNLLPTASTVCLVHNAVFYQTDSIDSLAEATLRLTLETNVITPTALNKLFIPYMLPGSVIIYIGTTLAEKAVPGSASYAISKHAVVGLMRATCQDLIEKGIRSCCVSPGLVDTQLLKATMDDATQQFLLNNKIIGKRLIKPEEIAKVIYFCATNPVINGNIIQANLGQVAD